MTRDAAERSLLWINTVRHLRARQIVHRARLRAQRLAIVALPRAAQAALMHRPSRRYGWPESFVPMDQTVAEGFPDAHANAENRFTFLNEERNLGVPENWEPGDVDRLWRYHLHYFEWAWSFATHPDRQWAAAEFERLWRSWAAQTSLRSRDVWSPYVASVRAWALCGLYAPLVSGRNYGDDVLESLRLHAGFLRTHLELDVGGNHLIKNIKGLIGLGVFLDDGRMVQTGIRLLSRELGVQVLSDGGHYERSPSYHCHVLGDLIDVDGLLRRSGWAHVDGLAEAIRSMRSWLGAMLMPDGNVPLFNDCTLVNEKRLKTLGPTAPDERPLVVLQPSGYVVMKPDERLHLVADVGPPCPDELPAHAHADCLSFELAVDGRRVIVDTGTSTYIQGDRRQYERSTRAHNTVEIDGTDQTEVWGVFRAARLARPHVERAHETQSRIEVVGSHTGYEARLPGAPIHRRSWSVRPGEIAIDDEIRGTGLHKIAARLYFRSSEEIKSIGPADAESKSMSLSFSHGKEELSYRIESGTCAFGFGKLAPVDVLTIEATADLPLRLGVRFQLAPEDADILDLQRNTPR
jgi:Heparinase II/III-like protein/Heparinase II/III N-terminus